MPDESLPGGDMSACMNIMQDENDYTEEQAAKVCQALSEEKDAENGNVEELKDALADASRLISDVGVDLNSAVDVPAIDSKFVAFKSSDGDGKELRSRLVLKDDADKQIAYAPAMIPREIDKEGDVVPTSVVEQAAHDYLAKGDTDAIDTDHSMIDGKGTVVESWVLQDDRTWDTPSGDEKSYRKGTWMLGIQWEDKPWGRIQNGELEGLSIQGMAEQVALKSDDAPGMDGHTKAFEVPLADESVVHLVYESETAATKASEEMGLEGRVHEHEFDGMNVFMPGETHDDFVSAYMDEAEKNLDDPEFSEGDAVRWSSQDTPVHGRVAGVHEQYSPAEGVTITGEDGEAVYSIYEYDDSLEDPVFRDSPSDPNIAKPQSSLSESNLDMPSATDENFSKTTGETDKAARGESIQHEDTMTDTQTDGPDFDVDAVADAVVEKLDDSDTDTEDTEKGGPVDTAVDALSDMAEAPDDPGALREGIVGLLDADTGDDSDPSLEELVAEKEVGPEDVADLIAAMDGVDASAGEVGEMLADLMEGDGEEDGMDQDGMHGDEEKDTEKSASEDEQSNLSKGATVGAGTTAGETQATNTGLSYKALADEEAGEHL